MAGAAGTCDRAPRRIGEVWVHIDRFDKPNGRVWAVQYVSPKTGKPIYRTASRVVSVYGFHTDWRAGARQPKAWIVIRPAAVRWRGSVAEIIRNV